MSENFDEKTPISVTENVPDNTMIKESVVSFTEIYDEPNGAQLLAYWRDLKGSRDRPAWSEFDFLDIFKITPYLIIKDVIDGGAEFRNRFWGTSHVDQGRFDGTGKTVADYYKPEDVQEILELYRKPLNSPTPMVMRGQLHYQDVGKWQTYSAVCVGFTGDDGAVAKLVCAYDG